MKILIACEESQAVTIEFRKLGFQAYSCDIQDQSGGFPEWHIKGDVLEVIKQGWDVMIAFPPCTHLAVSGAAWFEQKRKDGRQQEGIEFFMKMVNAPIKHIAIENPIGIMSKEYRRPDQIIHPYYFGDATSKATCLWLKNLPLLYHNREIDLFNDNYTWVKPKFTEFYCKKTGKMKRYSTTADRWYKNAEKRSRERSKTFPGIAIAMASQWGQYLNNLNN
jgi:site-specific DNA-cytosine methylase